EMKYPILWFDTTGHSLGATPLSGQLQDLRLSPDGTRAAEVNFEGGATADLFVYDLKTGTRTRLTFGENTWFLAWSPDGKRLAYSAEKVGTGNVKLYLKRADGSAERELLLS